MITKKKTWGRSSLPIYIKGHLLPTAYTSTIVRGPGSGLVDNLDPQSRNNNENSALEASALRIRGRGYVRSLPLDKANLASAADSILKATNRSEWFTASARRVRDMHAGASRTQTVGSMSEEPAEALSPASGTHVLS